MSIMLALALVVVEGMQAVTPAAQEMEAAKSWFKDSFSSGPVNYPFSFLYGGKKSSDLLKDWKLEHQREQVDAFQVQETLTLTDPESGMQLKCVAVVYEDFPTIEWTMYFKNNGAKDSPVLSSILPLDMRLRRQNGKEYVLHHAQGSLANAGDYGPRTTVLAAHGDKNLGGSKGRPTGDDWSYWNLDWAEGGVIVGMGWPGQWAAEIARDGTDGIRMRAGQQTTRFLLMPGEEVRTPRIVLLFWKGGDWLRSQNVWRRWMMAHNMPRPGGKLPEPQVLASSSRAYEEMIKADTEKQIIFIDRYIEEGIKLDYWWMDAGWYIQQKGWPQVGTWEVDPARFPNGLKPISDHAHSKGMKILVWFEPERVAPDTWLTQNHPEWVLGGKSGGILNLGNDEAREWLTNHIDGLIVSQGIDLYRQDFNIEPLNFWTGTDEKDRDGLTEIRHITGYLVYWDELRRRHPDMLIDSCASGGRRNDVETMRRAVPLWRSDYAFEPIGHQCMTYGISMWLPYHGTGTVACSDATYYGGGLTPVEPYAFWSNATPSISCGFDMRVRELDYAALRKLFEQWRGINRFYYADYYPLTSYSRDDKQWMAWQFNDETAGEGIVQAFRRPKCVSNVLRVKLRDLDPAATYTVTNIDTGEAADHPGKDLAKAGLTVRIESAPGAAVMMYKKK